MKMQLGFHGFHKAFSARGGEFQQHPKGLAANIGMWGNRLKKGTWLWFLLLSPGSRGGFGFISALFGWLWWAGGGQEKRELPLWPGNTLNTEGFPCGDFDTSTSVYSSFSWKKIQWFYGKGKSKLNREQNQPRMFLPHVNETFWSCQNKPRKLKQSVLILPSRNQHISFKMFWFQSDCIFLQRKKLPNILLRRFHPDLVLDLSQEARSRSEGLIGEQRYCQIGYWKCIHYLWIMMEKEEKASSVFQ